MQGHESPVKQASFQASEEAQHNEWQLPKPCSFCCIRVSSHTIGQNQAPELGCLPPSRGPEAVGWALPRGHQCDREGH